VFAFLKLLTPESLASYDDVTHIKLGLSGSAGEDDQEIRFGRAPR
jgi:hypothetical protein